MADVTQFRNMKGNCEGFCKYFSRHIFDKSSNPFSIQMYLNIMLDNLSVYILYIVYTCCRNIFEIKILFTNCLSANILGTEHLASCIQFPALIKHAPVHGIESTLEL